MFAVALVMARRPRPPKGDRPTWFRGPSSVHLPARLHSYCQWMRLNTYRTDAEGYKRLLAWNEHLVASALSPAIRALIETRVSQINGCTFCLAMHTDEARQAGVPQDKLDVVAAWRDAGSFSEEERAALGLAEAMTRLADDGRITDETWSLARQCFDDDALAALIQVVALINAFNRINVVGERTAEDYYRFARTRTSR